MLQLHEERICTAQLTVKWNGEKIKKKYVPNLFSITPENEADWKYLRLAACLGTIAFSVASPDSWNF